LSKIKDNQYQESIITISNGGDGKKAPPEAVHEGPFVAKAVLLSKVDQAKNISHSKVSLKRVCILVNFLNQPTMPLKFLCINVALIRRGRCSFILAVFTCPL